MFLFRACPKSRKKGGKPGKTALTKAPADIIINFVTLCGQAVFCPPAPQRNGSGRAALRPPDGSGGAE